MRLTPPTVFEVDLLYFVDSLYQQVTEGVHIIWILIFNIFLQNYAYMNLATETCKTDCHDMAEILLKVALNPIQSINQSNITLLGTDSFNSVISAGC